jgi:hypothetical protein
LLACGEYPCRPSGSLTKRTEELLMGTS